MNNKSDGDMAFVVALGVLLLAWMIWLVSSITIVATWISKLAYYLCNFLLGGLLDRIDALVILMSGFLYSALGWGMAIVYMPDMVKAGITPQEVMLSLATTGFIFGMGIGYRLLAVDLWEQEYTPSAINPRFIDSLNLPPSQYQQQQNPTVQPEREITLDELEQMFKVQPATTAG